MPNLEFSINIPAQPWQLVKLSEDYENLSKFLPDQLKQVKILEQNDNETITEEKIVFSTLLKKEIIQQARHVKIGNNQLCTEIISGPAKGSKISVLFESSDSGSKISFEVELKLEFKAKILRPLIIKYYKMVLTSVLYKMNNSIVEAEENKKDG